MSQNLDAFNKKTLSPESASAELELWRDELRRLWALALPFLRKLDKNLWRIILYICVLSLLLAILQATLGASLTRDRWQVQRPLSLESIVSEQSMRDDYMADFDTPASWNKRVPIKLDAVNPNDFKNNTGTRHSVWVSLSQDQVQVTGSGSKRSLMSLEEFNVLPHFTPLSPFEFSTPTADMLKPELVVSSRSDNPDWRQSFLFDDLAPRQQSFSSTCVTEDFLRQCQRFRQKIFVANLGKDYSAGSSFMGSGQYRGIVDTFAKRYNLSSDLVLSIMRVESNYVPSALSRSNAMGLMQLVPHTAGWEAHLYLTGKKEVPGSDILFDPAKNIEYGMAYLHLLFTRHFPDVTDRASRELCVIAAYNGGPNAVWRSFDSDRGRAVAKINSLSPGDIYEHLTSNMASLEARIYVDKVLTARNNTRLSFSASAAPSAPAGTMAN